MRKRFLTLVCLSLLVVLTMLSVAHGQKPGTAPPVPLRVTVEVSDSNANACRICPDGLGEYVDAVDGVRAGFSKNGYLGVFFSSSRTVTFDYSFPGNPPPPPTILPMVDPQVYSGVDPDKILQNMTFGMTECIGLTWNYSDGGNTTRSHGFQFGPHVAGSSYGIITCTQGSNPDNTGQCVKWVVEPKVDDCNSDASIAGINDRVRAKGKTTDNDRGLYRMPFKLTLVRK